MISIQRISNLKNGYCKSFQRFYMKESFPSSVRIVEVGVRDGLQNEPLPAVSTNTKVQLVHKLLDAGLKTVEVGSFVSPKWIPQMANSSDVFKALRSTVKPSQYANFSALTPNLKGLESALALDVQEVAVFGSASEAFSQKNINCSVEESIDRFTSVCQIARSSSTEQGPLRIRGYVSCVLGCPYEGTVSPEAVAYVTKRLLQLGCYEVSLGDTIGTGTVGSTARLLRHLLEMENIPANRLAVHFHNTYGQALSNIYVALEHGIRVIDSSVSGLGGCPYAKGASGNVPTEDVLYMLEGLGISTGTTKGDGQEVESGVDMKKLLDAARFIDGVLKRETQSKGGAAFK